ncbi:phytanoyl-CoA dioxygenase family protein [Pseudomonas aeruginosa]|uniref:phytanoyl-CoA dioxygenase family protein n=1 Tax=Pseudomonas aeruginosa TaxID=287 RepID=UPI0015BC554C|nr:phytanoyl-CoA dioxygenase family protein [Pseudomonas aeruginosa]MBX5668833.1 phytanoyl-CoA dioxygenase family protein [Pseudomonas aeruginosa]MBX5679114.1 phytanoyl-CoA dioxygenase family protein [Pseudomonas aeruginosa]MBX5753437.1 phytanoyl-CoA dioxygenase family protein [Pseudomonas aeruginosa]MBX6073695.1 phytanoyl-CoA dioxygenase family protein [Pseudomonas aeruginosa]MBX6117697.1 phytanoyl-CoA dioxygenase family protein [Pseudomonas aeruginosa]
MSFPAYPTRVLTAEEIQRYRDDGVIMIKGAIDPNWMALIESGIEEARHKASMVGRFMSRKVEGYQMDIFLWKRIDALRDLIYYGPFARWAQQLMGAQEVRFFYDQMFIKEPGTDAPTPWHQDLSFWPIRGEQICSFWIPCDPVTRANSGLMYVRGSHKWPQRFKAISPDYVAAIIDDSMDDIPDINANLDQYELLDWEMEPGDILMFHPLTLHGSYGNQSRTMRRRALALRWTGEDVVYAPTAKRMPINYEHASVSGGPLRGAAFPRILPEMDPAERAARVLQEHQAPLKLLDSTLKNALSAVRLKLKGGSAKSLQQTWTR